MTSENRETPDEKIIVTIDEELKDLIPGFLNNRRGDIQKIVAALPDNDFETIRVLGHSMKGAGGGYGFDTITDIGNALEQAAKEESKENILKQMKELSFYLDHLEVRYE